MRDIILALFIFGTIPFVLSRPFIGLLVWSWLGYMNPYRLCYGFAYNFPWVQIIAILTLVSFAASNERKKIPWTLISVLVSVFLGWTGFTTLFALEPSTAVPIFKEFAKTIVMVLVTLMLVHDRERMHWLVWMIVVSLGFYGVKGGAFTLLGGGSSHVLGPPGSFIGDNNSIALALCMTLPLMRYLQLHAQKKVVRVGLAVAMLLTAFAVLGTYSRGGLIALFVVSMALLLKGRRRIAVSLFLIVVGATAYHFMPPQWMARMHTLHDASQTSSAETRIESWEFAANLAMHRPLVGGGFNAYQNAATWMRYAPSGAVQRAVHSIYFRVLGEQGFVGLTLFLALLAASWHSCSRVRKRTRDSPGEKWAFDLASMLQVSLAAFLSAGAFLSMTYFDLTWQLMALCALLQLYVTRAASEHANAHGAAPAVRPREGREHHATLSG